MFKFISNFSFVYIYNPFNKITKNNKYIIINANKGNADKNKMCKKGNEM